MAPDSPAVPLDAADARTAARNASVLALASIVSKGALFGWQLILARLLSQAGYGIYGTIGGMLGIAAALPEFGMGLIVLRDVAGRRDLAGRALSATLVMQPLLAALAYALLILAGALLGYEEAIRALLPLAGLNLFVDLLGNMAHNQLLARDQMLIPSLIGIGHIGALVVLVGLALLGGGGLAGLYTATITAGCLRGLAYWLALLRERVYTHWPFDRSVARSLLANGAPLALASFLGLAYQHADKIISTATLGEAQTALLTAAFVLVVGVVELLNTTVLVAVFPLMSRQQQGGQREAFNFLVEKIAYFTLVITVPVGIITSLLASPIVNLFFPGYTRTVDVLAVLIWFGVVTMVANVFAQVMIIQNRQRRLLLLRAGGLALNITLSILLLPRIGVPGAAVSSVTAELGVLALLLRQWESGPARLKRLMPRLLRLGVAGALMAAAILLLRPAHAIVALLGGGVVYLGAVWGLRVFSAEDTDFLRSVLTALPGGGLIARMWR